MTTATETFGQRVDIFNLPRRLGEIVDNFTWRRRNLEGKRYRVKEVEVPVVEGGIVGKVTMLVADFRKKGERAETLFFSCPGMPGMPDEARRAILSGSESETMEGEMMKQAAAAGGVVFFPNMKGLPHAADKTSTPTFGWDAKVILAAVDKLNLGINWEKDNLDINLSGYSNGGCEALALAGLICQMNKNPDLSLAIQTYGMVGLLPIDNLPAAAMGEAWSWLMSQARLSFQEVTGEIMAPVGVVNEVLFLTNFLAILGQDAKMLRQVTEHFAKTMVGGNVNTLSVIKNLARKFLRDPQQVALHFQKFKNTDYLKELDGRVSVKVMVVPEEKMAWKALKEIIGVEGDWSKLNLRTLLPNVGNFLLQWPRWDTGALTLTHAGPVANIKAYMKLLY